MKNNFEKLLSTTTNKVGEIKESDSLAGKLSQFDKADEIMKKISNAKNEPQKEKIEYVTYAIPESFIKAVNEIIKKCMREEISINKSEIIRLGIQMVNELSLDELVNRLDAVKITKGRPKLS
jgi:uncharacterized membrane-anchored protein YjiN (DUF445 family)